MDFPPFLFLLILGLFSLETQAQDKDKIKPIKVGIDGLTHTHVHWILGREEQGDIEIVGIAEPNRELAERYAKQHGYSMDIVFPSLEEMIEATKPEAVTAFNPIYDHLKTVRICASQGIHVMVEKPLAVNYEHAVKMKAIANRYGIHLLTNYETSWYPSNAFAYGILHSDQSIGEVRKIVVHDGHQGPKEIGVNEEFLEWLTDPVLNGGGAITDFGCYGANLATWLMKGERPLSVYAMTQQIKPQVYPKVDDDATIILRYPQAQVIIQASWNWPFSRKDLHLYGETGYVYADNGVDVRYRLKEELPEKKLSLAGRSVQPHDPFAYLQQVVRGAHSPPPFDLSSLENNMIVMEILEAAKQSAATGKEVKLAPGLSPKDVISLHADAELVKISDHLYLHRTYTPTQGFGRVASNGLVYGKKGAAILFDTPMSEELTADILDYVKAELGWEIKAAVINHFHTDGGMGGIKTLHERGIQTYAHTKTFEKAKSEKLPLPMVEMKDTYDLEIGALKVQNRYFGPGHAPDNIVSYLPEERLLFGGCMIKCIGAGKGYLGDADVEKWPQTVKAVEMAFPEAEIIIPGHGPHGGRDLLQYTQKLFDKP
ncbi:MAG: subclass B1 metallo-beta-lactamase [Bacteroidota bacterium]